MNLRYITAVGSFWFTILVAPTGNAQGTIAFIPTSVGGDQGLNSEDDSRGWVFVPSPFIDPDLPITVTGLGVYDPGGDGLVNAHEIGLWSVFSGTLLASAVVPAGTVAPIINGYRIVSIQPLLLPQTQIVIGAQYRAGDADGVVMPNFGQFADRINYLRSVYLASASLTMPGLVLNTGNQGDPFVRFFSVNFQYQLVPEPSATMLMVVGLVAVFLFRHNWYRL